MIHAELLTNEEFVLTLPMGKAGPTEGGKKPYGDVKYADPGYKEDGKKRYPLTANRLQAAWTYINQPENKEGYTDEQYEAVKSRIVSAYRKHFGHHPGEDEEAKKSISILKLLSYDTLTLPMAKAYGLPGQVHEDLAHFHETQARTHAMVGNNEAAGDHAEASDLHRQAAALHSAAAVSPNTALKAQATKASSTAHAATNSLKTLTHGEQGEDIKAGVNTPQPHSYVAAEPYRGYD